MPTPTRPIISAIDNADYPHMVCRRFLVTGARPGERTLDVGCGSGELLSELANVGCSVIGTEIDPDLVEACRRSGLDVRHGKAEQLPFEDATFDRIVCSVVIPYTDEAPAIAEWARTLKAGGRAYASYHGLGYAFFYMLRGASTRDRVYGLRMLLNTCLFWATGRRLPGSLGDTTCQSAAKLRGYYSRVGLVLERETIAAEFLGFPRFICHQVVKTEERAATQPAPPAETVVQPAAARRHANNG